MSNALIGCDIVASTSSKASGTYGPGVRAVINTAGMPTGDIVRHRDARPHRFRCIGAKPCEVIRACTPPTF